MRKFLSLGFSCAMLMACASQEVSPTGLTLMSEGVYHSTVERFTDSTEKYSGLYNTIMVKGTLLNSKVAQAQLDQSARLYQWDQARYTEEANKGAATRQKETQVFISFYTPDRKHDDLHKNKTLWRIFLDIDGKRVEGKASKIKLVLSEIQSLYEYHTRFGTPYLVTFNVPTSLVEKAKSKMTVTGSVGSASLEFPAAE